MNSLKNYILAIISVSLFSVASFAQEIEEIIVTANKREANRTRYTNEYLCLNI